MNIKKPTIPIVMIILFSIIVIIPFIYSKDIIEFGDVRAINKDVQNVTYDYRNTTIFVPVYDDVVVEVVDSVCYVIGEMIYDKKVTNKSCYTGYNITKRKIVRYDEKVVNSTIKRLIYKNFTYNYPSRVYNKSLVVSWNRPIGNRNFKEFGRCRQFEIEKGVCYENKV